MKNSETLCFTGLWSQSKTESPRMSPSDSMVGIFFRPMSRFAPPDYANKFVPTRSDIFSNVAARHIWGIGGFARRYLAVMLFVTVLLICATPASSRKWSYEELTSQRFAYQSSNDRYLDVCKAGEHKALFKQAMRHWENYTCLSFVERTPEDESYIVFTVAECGCCSYVGKRGEGPQAISIGNNCDKFGIVVHELGHVVGFWHEHTRPDRDQFVDIYYKNIQQACGRTLMNPKGRISIPENSGKEGEEESLNSAVSLDCQWRIVATKGERISLNLTALVLPDSIQSVDCQKEKANFLEIRDGHYEKSRLIVECGGYISADEGTLQSPNYPDDYRSNQDCVWYVTVPEDYQVALRIQLFQLEQHQDCIYDRLEVYDGHGEGAKRLGKYCGYTLPVDVKSSGNQMKIRFYSDSPVEKGGFALEFIKEFDECKTGQDGCQHKCVNTLGGFRCECDIGYELHIDGKSCEDMDECDLNNGHCDQICRNTIGSYECQCQSGFVLAEDGHNCKEGGCKYELNAPNGEISSPNYPDEYPNKKECVWHFVTTPGHRLELKFQEFEVEPHQSCRYDRVELYDGSSTSATSLGTYCGPKVPDDILSTKNELYMLFVTDPSVSRKGFLAEYTSKCGGTLQADETVGYIYSHAKYGGSDYDTRMECEWTILAQPDLSKVVGIRFKNFDVEDENNCEYDWVQIYDGEDERSTDLGRFCGKTLPPSKIASGNVIRVQFHTDDTVQSKGFVLEYFLRDPLEEGRQLPTPPTEPTVKPSLEPVINERNKHHS